MSWTFQECAKRFGNRWMSWKGMLGKILIGMDLMFETVILGETGHSNINGKQSCTAQNVIFSQEILNEKMCGIRYKMIPITGLFSWLEAKFLWSKIPKNSLLYCQNVPLKWIRIFKVQVADCYPNHIISEFLSNISISQILYLFCVFTINIHRLAVCRLHRLGHLCWCNKWLQIQPPRGQKW